MKGGRAGNDGHSPRAAVFSPSPGLRPPLRTKQHSSAKEASAEEREIRMLANIGIKFAGVSFFTYRSDQVTTKNSAL